MIKAYAKDIVPLLEKPDLSGYVFYDDNDNVANGTGFVTQKNDSSKFISVNFENGILTNAFWEDMGHIQPAVEGAGYMEYRVNGVLDDPVILKGVETAARASNGFAHHEYWKKGKLVKVSDRSYDENGEEVWTDKIIS